METLIFKGTKEKHNGLQIVDVNIDYNTNVVNMGMNSFDIQGFSDIKFININAKVYTSSEEYHWAKSDVFFRDVNGKLFRGGYFCSLEIETNKLTEHYTL